MYKENVDFIPHSTHHSLGSLGPVYFWKLSEQLAPEFYYSSKPKVAFVRTDVTIRGHVQLDIGYLSQESGLTAMTTGCLLLVAIQAGN